MVETQRNLQHNKLTFVSRLDNLSNKYVKPVRVFEVSIVKEPNFICVTVALFLIIVFSGCFIAPRYHKALTS